MNGVKNRVRIDLEDKRIEIVLAGKSHPYNSRDYKTTHTKVSLRNWDAPFKSPIYHQE